MKTLTRISTTLALGTLLAAPAMAEPVEYQIDTSHTFARFSYDHFGLSTQLSRFDDVAGTVVFDADAKTGAVDVTIDTTSVDTGFATFNEHIQGEEFLHTGSHPEATFTSTQVIFEGDTPSQIVGDLTLKGVTQSVTLDITRFVSVPHPMLQKPAIGADAQGTILRSDFNMDKFVPNVGDEVTISIAIEAIAP